MIATKLYDLQIRGKHHSWHFTVSVDPQYVEEWQADGLVIEPICNIIPEWVVNAGLLRPWIFLQDLFNFKNPWGGK